jgi:hypothetical protein
MSDRVSSPRGRGACAVPRQRPRPPCAALAPAGGPAPPGAVALTDRVRARRLPSWCLGRLPTHAFCILQDKNEMLQRLSGLHETLDRLKYEGIVSGGESLAEAGSSFAPYSPSSPSGGADGFLPRGGAGGAGAERWAPPPAIMNPDVTIYSAVVQHVSPAPASHLTCAERPAAALCGPASDLTPRCAPPAAASPRHVVELLPPRRRAALGAAARARRGDAAAQRKRTVPRRRRRTPHRPSRGRAARHAWARDPQRRAAAPGGGGGGRRQGRARKAGVRRLGGNGSKGAAARARARVAGGRVERGGGRTGRWPALRGRRAPSIAPADAAGAARVSSRGGAGMLACWHAGMQEQRARARRGEK